MRLLIIAACAALAGCSSGTSNTKSSAYDREALFEQMAQAAVSGERDRIAAVLPQCLRVLKGASVDPAIMQSKGYKKRNSLTGPYWANQVSKSGFARSGVMHMLHEKPGRSCKIGKHAGSGTRGFSEIAHATLVANGFEPTGEKAGTFGNWKIYRADGMKVKARAHSSRQTGGSDLELKKL